MSSKERNRNIKLINNIMYTREQLSKMTTEEFLTAMGFEIQIGNIWNRSADKYAWTETSKDGYDLYVLSDNNSHPSICDDIHYDEYGFIDSFKEYIQHSCYCEETIAIEEHLLEDVDALFDEDEMFDIAVKLDKAEEEEFEEEVTE